MPLTRKQKEDLVAGYRDGLASADNVFVVGYQGVSVPQVTELRAKVRETGGDYVVVKNTLVLRAIDGGGLDGLKEHFVGPTAVAYSQEGPVALAKVLHDFAKTVPAIHFKGGVVEGQAVTAADVEEIASLPTREELLTKLVFLLQSPVTRFVRTLAQVPQQFVSVLDQVRQQKEQDSAS